MPETNERTKEVIQWELDQVQKDLKELYDTVNKQEYKTGEQTKKMEELEKQEEDLKKELEGSKGSDSSESLNMSKDEAIKYLESIKDKTWGEMSKERKKWITAVQVVLKDKWYDPWTIDWILGKGKSKTRKAVKKFQKDAGFKWKDIDWKPGPKTIKALLGEKSSDSKENEKKDKKDESGENKADETKTETDSENKSFTWTYKDGKPDNWTFVDKDGTKWKVENGEVTEEIK